MRIFDTKVQYLKYCAIKEVCIAAFNGKLDELYYEAPKKVIPGPKATMRCCIYKERAIFTERLKLASSKISKQVIQVLDIACDDCEASGYIVTSSCRGCIAHRCKQVCRFDAIKFDDKQKAYIDKSKCVNCGMCAKNCQYTAIVNNVRPCEKACNLKAIKMGDNNASIINYDKCISCGACVYQCPFGAISDKSFVVDIINMILNSDNNKNYRVYAIVAPSIASQFTFYPLPKVITAIKKIGFYSVIETALGADMIANKESKELVEKGTLTSSCCPAFVKYIQNSYPKLVDKISSNLSPMAELGKYLKSIDKTSKVVFIGPCSAKKEEFQLDSVKDYVDCVMTFEELIAMIDSLAINVNELEDTYLDNASYFGRIFARSGGLKDAVTQAINENNIQFELKPTICNGIVECKQALAKLNGGNTESNFIEGMACSGGCIGGPCCISHTPKNASDVDKYGNMAKEKTIHDSIKLHDNM